MKNLLTQEEWKCYLGRLKSRGGRSFRNGVALFRCPYRNNKFKPFLTLYTTMNSKYLTDLSWNAKVI